MIITPLSGHTNEETSYLVNDYPYGNKRCRIRYWVEESKTKGFRFVSQTEHPKTFRWNAPKKSTYDRLAGALFLDEKNYVQYVGLSEYSNPLDVLNFITNFPRADHSRLFYWAVGKKTICQVTINGEAVISIGGKPCLPNEKDIEKAKEDIIIWEQCLELLRSMKYHNFPEMKLEPPCDTPDGKCINHGACNTADKCIRPKV